VELGEGGHSHGYRPRNKISSHLHLKPKS